MPIVANDHQYLNESYCDSFEPETSIRTIVYHAQTSLYVCHTPYDISSFAEYYSTPPFSVRRLYFSKETSQAEVLTMTVRF